MSGVSYDKVDIDWSNSTVYADPPYKSTHRYTTDFDNKAFYEWVRSRPFPVYVSEYSMPDDFAVVKAIQHRSTLCATRNNLTIEKVFVHERWAYKVYMDNLFRW
ncbi:MAG: hypothetical protein HUK08_00330 [Bacteroidaceae bacterium]|nr:hypothetical protein [Bacteroidaceae bacterium]